MELTTLDRLLIAELQAGLPLVAAPYAAIAERLGWREAEVIAGIRRLMAGGVVNRFGLVVRHHELGYRANAMVVWDVADAAVDAVALRFVDMPFVNLCYRRPRRMPAWPYNLFVMIHGKEREDVLGHTARLAALAGADARTHEVLFSGTRYKQRGARYVAVNQEDAHG
jgi:DNA-binding Lrp family transcriptional regulator